jgi:hypothetical protein
MKQLAIPLSNQNTVAKWLVIKMQSSPKRKARKKFRRAAYGLYVSKKTKFQRRVTFRLAGTKFFLQRSSWDEMWIFRGIL